MENPKFLADHKEHIVTFADLDQFIDVSVKYYASGIRAKLGFAIASQIEQDILIFDEVLGVGDIRFAKRAQIK